jgi:hypothetical protein
MGAIDLLENGHTPLLISHAGEGATSDAQTTLSSGLKKHYTRQNFARLRIWMDFKEWHIRNVASENTTRGRSFLLFAAGVFGGTGLTGNFTLRVPENIHCCPPVEAMMQPPRKLLLWTRSQKGGLQAHGQQ